MTLYAPPVLENPLTFDTFTSDLNTITIPNDRDAIINLPGTPLTCKGVRINGGRNIHLISGGLVASQNASSENISLLRFYGCTGRAHVEGVILDCNNKDGMDAFNFGNTDNSPVGEYCLQNSKIKGVRQISSPWHGDAIQPYGGYKSLQVVDVDIETRSQGIFLAPQGKIMGHTELTRVTIKPIGDGEYYPLYLRDASETARPPIYLEDVYVGKKNYNPYSRPDAVLWETYSLYPHAEMTNGCVRVGNIATWPKFPEIKGDVRYLSSQSFAPENVGANYTPSEYQGI